MSISQSPAGYAFARQMKVEREGMRIMFFERGGSGSAFTKRDMSV